MYASSPTVGRSLLEKTRTVAEPLFLVHNACKTIFQDRISEVDLTTLYHKKYACRPHIVSDSSPPSDIYELAAAAVVLNWLTGVGCGGIGSTSSLSDAETWFQGSYVESALTSILTRNEDLKSQKVLQSIDVDDHFLEILPYAI